MRLIFQPAEEGGHGAQRMIEAGALAGVDEVFGYHNWPPIPFGRAGCVPGTIFAANGEWSAVITGRGGHASTPQLCIDPILAGAHFVTLVQQIVSRQIAPQESAVVSVTCFHGGTADNIIPEQVELVGHGARRHPRCATSSPSASPRRCCRGLRPERGARTASTTAPATRPRSTIPAQPRAPPARRPRSSAPRRWSSTGLPVMAAEDFGYYLARIPGCFILLGAGMPGAAIESCHSPRFDFNDRPHSGGGAPVGGARRAAARERGRPDGGGAGRTSPASHSR